MHQVTPELLRKARYAISSAECKTCSKERGLEVTDRIELTVSATGGNTTLAEAFNRFREYVMNETLAISARWLDTAAEGSVTIESGETSWEADIVRVAE